MDVNIVLSIINLKLRDFYSSLEELIENLNNAEEMIKCLTENGYKYDENLNKFIARSL